MSTSTNEESHFQSNDSSSLSVIIDKAIKGDQPAFRELYNLLSGKMYSLCLRYSGNTHDANDLLQEGFIRVYKNLSSFKGHGSFEGWARRVFTNTCLDFLRRKKTSFADIEQETIQTKASDLTGYEKLTYDQLFGMIQELPSGYRTIVNLYMVEGYNHKEIADMLNISEGTSKSQLHRAKSVLQEKLNKLN
jgi:RNA polymerase sigma-70 factor (ECF subfamily)